MLITEDNRIEYIFRYLENDLSAPERNQFEELVKNDQSLKNDIELCRNVNDFLKENAAMLEIKSSLNEMQQTGSLDEIKQSVNEHNKKLISDESYRKNIEEFKKKLTQAKSIDIKEKKIIKLRPFIYIAAAAIALLLITTVAIFYFNKKVNYTPDNFFSMYYEKYQPDIKKRSLKDITKPEIKEYYCSKKYEIAVDSFKKIEVPGNSDIFYAAMSYIELNKFEDAATKLELLLKTNNSFFISAEWYAALCYIKTGDYSKAVSLLKSCAERKSVYSGKAKELLEKLYYQCQGDSHDTD